MVAFFQHAHEMFSTFLIWLLAKRIGDHCLKEESKSLSHSSFWAAHPTYDYLLFTWVWKLDFKFSYGTPSQTWVNYQN